MIAQRHESGRPTRAERRFGRRAATLGILGSMLLFGQPIWAARLLQVYIEQDGETVAHTYYDDSGRVRPATVWRYLGDPPIMVDTDVTEIAASANDPMRAELEGDVRIRFQLGRRVLAEVHVSRLDLHRPDNRTQAWFLPESEVERTAGLAGLGPPSPIRDDWSSPDHLAALAAVIVAFFALVAVIIFVASRAATTRIGE